MKEPIVADSTCLIGLDRIGRLELLSAVFDPILISPEVEREFGRTLPWLRVEAPANHALVASLKMLVDDGEAEAISLAYEKDTESFWMIGMRVPQPEVWGWRRLVRLEYW